MEHPEARELLEIAAVEPGGFERLAAGDIAEAAALAGHLAGCPACAAEMERLRLSSAMIRDAVRTLPPPDLRDRTLAFVAALGRDRGAAMGMPAVGAAPSRGGRVTERRRRLGLWAASLAAAVVIAVIGTAAFVGASHNQLADSQAREIAALNKVTTWTLRIDGQPDASRVALTGSGGSAASGTLVYSPASSELVVFAHGLPEPAPGMEYRCWVDVGGSRTRIGQMFLAGDIAYWVGPVSRLPSPGVKATFGVSLVPSQGDSLGGDPVLVGAL